MKLKEYTLIILLLFIILFVCIGSVSALENQTEGSCEKEVISISETPNILTDSQYTYDDLKRQFSPGVDIKLVNGNYTYGDGDTIKITTSSVIDGNGAVIDMAGSGIRAFEITEYGVTIKNLTIKNANYNGNGGAIYFSDQGNVENCNFINNKGSDNDGGAIYFNDRGTVINCNFTSNSAHDGGAIWIHSGSVTNCNFINNTATINNGSAVYFNDQGQVINSNFTNNNATSVSAIYFNGNKSTKIISNSIFLN